MIHIVQSCLEEGKIDFRRISSNAVLREPCMKGCQVYVLRRASGPFGWKSDLCFGSYVGMAAGIKGIGLRV